MSEMRERLLLVFCGVAAGASLFVSFLWPVAFVALYPLLRTALLERGHTSWQLFLRGSLWGFGLMGTSLSYGFSMLPLTWLGIENVFVGALTAFFLWFSFSCVLALPAGCFAFVLHFFRKVHTLAMLVLVPVLWLSFELLRATLETVFALGPGTFVGPHFTFGFLGYAVAWADGLLSLARIGGVFFLSGAVAFVNVLVWLIAEKYDDTIKRALVCVTCMLVLWCGNALLPKSTNITVGPSTAIALGEEIVLVHTDRPARLLASDSHTPLSKKDLAAQITEALIVNPNAQVVILPEDSRFIETVASSSLAEERLVLAALRDRGALVIDSARLGSGQVVRGAVYGYDFGKSVPLGFSSKHFLIPGEYIPHVLERVLRGVGLAANVARLETARASYKPGEWNPKERLFTKNGVQYGTLSCSELFSPMLMHDLSKEGADVIVLISSQGWTPGGSPVLFNQMVAMAKVGAVWAGKPYVQATNVAPNLVVFPTED